MTILIFIIILSILILVHEWGHYIVAKKCGVDVEQFALGFGPKLYTKVYNNTEFCLCLFPLGGYVKMKGDERSKLKGSKDEFLSQPFGNKFLIVLMGPVVNLILAYVCFCLVFMIGKVDLEATSKKVPAIIGQVIKDSPALKAGLQEGDVVKSINGAEILNWPKLQEIVTKSNEGMLQFEVIRNSKLVNVSVIAEENIQKDIFGKEHKIRRIGVGPKQVQNYQDLVVIKYGPIESLKHAAIELADISLKTYAALYEMVVGARSPKEAMGIVGMFFVIKFAITIGFSFLLHIVGVISASLALFNLLPMIPLDGGHLVLFTIERIRGKALSVKIDDVIAKIGFSLIITLALFIFYVDFDRIGLFDHILKIFRG